MGDNQNTKVIGGTQIVVGLSAIVQVTSEAYVNGWTIKKFSGGSLTIVSATTSTIGTGYVVGDSEAINVDGPAMFYLSAVGATVTVHALQSKSSGAS